MRKKKHKRIYTYQCNVTQEIFKIGKQISNTADLVSVAGYYQLHPEEDDRSELAKLQALSDASHMPSKAFGVVDENIESNNIDNSK